MSQTNRTDPSNEPPRVLNVVPPFDLARTAAPVWWARGRWPNVDWIDGVLVWAGWEDSNIVWRAVRQIDDQRLVVTGLATASMDRLWAARVLGINARMPQFADSTLANLSARHRGMKPWAAGSLFEGAVSSIVGQSISVAAAATTERRLYALFNEPIEIGEREYWPPPNAEQLAAVDAALVRASGVTTTRARALIEVGTAFATGALVDSPDDEVDPASVSSRLLAISGIGPWTVRSTLLWGLGNADAHPTGDVALLRAVRKYFPAVSTLKELDAYSEQWKPYRGWAARLFWLDLLGHGG